MINQKTTWCCTDRGNPTENAHGVKYKAGYGYVVARGEWLCDNCMLVRETKAQYEEQLPSQSKVITLYKDMPGT